MSKLKKIKKILIIDDEISILESISEILIANQYQTIIYQNPTEVLPFLRRETVDLILLDIWMPEMDGHNLLKIIRYENPSLPIIIMSGHANITTSIEVTKSGADEFLEKPFNSQMLLNKVSKLLKKNITVDKDIELDIPVTLSNTIKQRTIAKSVVLKGKGLHTGVNTGIILSPMPVDSGIVFEDIPSEISFHASIAYASKENFYSTDLNIDNISLKVVEHLLATLNIYDITNVKIKASQEIPIMDGSALPFCDIIQEAGIEEQDKYSHVLAIDKTYKFVDPENEELWIKIEPYNGLIIGYTLELPKVFGKQIYQVDLSKNKATTFYQEIACCRTFGFVSEAKKLQEMGLAKGADLTNLLLLDDNKVINTKLQYNNEFARHKIIDIIGDLSLLRCPIRGKITAQRTGHRHNIALAKVIAGLFN